MKACHVFFILGMGFIVTSEQNQPCKSLLYPFNTWCKRLDIWAQRWREAILRTENLMQNKMKAQRKRAEQRTDRSTKSLPDCKIKNCRSCSTASKCLECKTGFYLQKLKRRKTTLCVHRCLWGYVVERRKGGSGVCLPWTQAGKCTTIHCFRCRRGFYQVNLGFLKKICVSSCPEGFFKDDKNWRCQKSFISPIYKLRHGYPT